MDTLNQYVLQLKTMSEGDHKFDFILDDQFFIDVEGTEVKGGNVAASVLVHKSALNIEIDLSLKGKVQTICDRCLDPLWVDVDTEESLYIKFGKAYSEENDDLIIIPEDEGTFNIAWTLYEFTALAIPISHCHPDGECNPEMINILNQHRVNQIDDEDDEDENNVGTNVKHEVDPRWAALKNILNN